MRDIFFTSDTHFGHDNIRSHCNRPFASVEEMDEAMIRRWNETVGVADIVYHLGDFAWRIQPHMAQILVGRLNGDIHLVPGNHDRIEMLRRVIGLRIEPHVLTTQVDSRALVLCHYSLRSWPGRVYGSWCLWGHCVDTATEILTDQGWRGHNQVRAGDIVLSYNSAINRIEPDPVLRVVHFPRSAGTMYTLNAKSVSMRVTSEHSCVIFSQHGTRMRKVTAREFFGGSRRTVLRCGVLDKPGLPISNALLKLVILLASDGSILPSGLCRIHLWRDRKKVYVRRVLSEVGVDFRELVQRDGSSSFNFSIPEPIMQYRIKGLDRKLVACSASQFGLIVEAYGYSDGHKIGDGVAVYSSKEEEIDLLQELAVQSGYGATKYRREHHGFSIKPAFCLLVFPASVCTLSRVRDRVEIEQVTDEHVWCIQCRNGNFFARRNGRVHLTGNSHGHLGPYGKSFDVGVDSHEFRPWTWDEVKEKCEKLDNGVVTE